MTKHDIVNELTKALSHIRLAEQALPGSSNQEVVARQHIREVRYIIDLIDRRIKPEEILQEEKV